MRATQLLSGIVWVITLGSLAKCAGIDFRDDPSISSGDCQLPGIVAQTKFRKDKDEGEQCMLTVRPGSFHAGGNKLCYVNGYNLAGVQFNDSCAVFLAKKQWEFYHSRVTSLNYPANSILGRSSTIDRSTKSMLSPGRPVYEYGIVYDGPIGEEGSLLSELHLATSELAERAKSIEGIGSAYEFKIAIHDTGTSANDGYAMCTIAGMHRQNVDSNDGHVTCDQPAVRIWKAQSQTVMNLTAETRRKLYGEIARIMTREAVFSRQARKGANRHRDFEVAHAALYGSISAIDEKIILKSIEINRSQLQYIFEEGRVLRWVDQELADLRP